MYICIVKEGSEFCLNICSQSHHYLEPQPEDQLEQTATTVQEIQPQGN